MAMQLQHLLDITSLQEFAQALQDYGVVQLHDVLELLASDLEEIGMTRVQVRRLQAHACKMNTLVECQQQRDTQAHVDKIDDEPELQGEKVKCNDTEGTSSERRAVTTSESMDESERERCTKKKKYRKKSASKEVGKRSTRRRSRSLSQTENSSSTESYRRGIRTNRSRSKGTDGRERDKYTRKKRRRKSAGKKSGKRGRKVRSRSPSGARKSSSMEGYRRGPRTSRSRSKRKRGRGRRKHRSDNQDENEKTPTKRDLRQSEREQQSTHSEKKHKQHVRNGSHLNEKRSNEASGTSNPDAESSKIEMKIDRVFGILEELHNSKSPVPEPGRDVTFLKSMQDGCQQYDPAMNMEAVSQWQHLLCEMDVKDLRHTHGDVAGTFMHGPHKGESVTDLTEGLLRGDVRPEDITPLVVLYWNENFWVLFGNRRLKALKDFAGEHLPKTVKVRCIVHRDQKAIPAPLVAKFILAWTTDNGGKHVAFRGWHRNNFHGWQSSNQRSAGTTSWQKRGFNYRKTGNVGKPTKCLWGHGRTLQQLEEQPVQTDRPWSSKPASQHLVGDSSAAPNLHPAERLLNAERKPAAPLCSTGHARVIGSPSPSADFYVRYCTGHKLGADSWVDFIEFELRSDRKFRYANKYRDPRESTITKDRTVSEDDLMEIKTMVEDSGILAQDPTCFPTPHLKDERVELVLVCGDEPIEFITSVEGIAKKGPSPIFSQLTSSLKGKFLKFARRQANLFD